MTWTLTVLTVLNFLNYVDRYVIAAVLALMKRDPIFAGVSDAQLGALQTAFLGVYMIVSPLAGLLGRRVPRKFLVAAGVGIWSLATVASGLSRSFDELLITRALIGFGEAGYATVAPAILSDLFARERRNRVLSIFYLATPVGSAMGFLVGGLVAQRAGWRPAFFVAGAPGLLFAAMALFIVEPKRGAHDAAPATRSSLGEGLRSLANRDFMIVTAGSTLMVFAVGGIAFWMPTFLQEVRHMSPGGANGAFGGIAVAAGILGTVGGGYAGDAWQRRDPAGYLKLSGYSLLVAAPFALAAPFVAWLPLSFALIFLAELFIFVNTGPLNTALVNACPAEVRELGVGLNVLAIHLLGDALSPPLLGALVDGLKQQGVAPDLAASMAVAATAVPLVGAALVLLHGARPK